MSKNHLYYIILIFILTGCGKKSLLPIDYISWIRDSENGLYQEKNIEKFIYSVQYEPIEYLVLIENKDSLENGEKYFKEKVAERTGLQYYLFNIKLNNSTANILKEELQDEAEYYKRIQYLLSEAQFDFKMIEGKDTLQCELYHFEQTYGLTPFISIVLAFKTTNSQNFEGNYAANKTFIFDDKIYRNGKLKFTIDDKNINNIPNLILM